MANDRPALSEPLHVRQGGAYQSHEFLKRWDQWQGRACRSDLENYVDGHVQFFFHYTTHGQSWEARAGQHGRVHGPSDVASIAAEGHDAQQADGQVGDQVPEAVNFKTFVVCRRHERPVLIGRVPIMEQIEQFVPALFSMRPQAEDEGVELWGNPVCESIFYGFLKPFRSFGKRELDVLAAPLIGSHGGNDFPVGIIQSGPESLKRVSSNDRGFIHHGFVLFGVGGSLTGFCVGFEDVLEGAAFAEQFVELTDVFRGPVNLEVGLF